MRSVERKLPSPEECAQAENEARANAVDGVEKRSKKSKIKSRRTLRACRRSRRGRATRFFIRGLARAANDAGVEFPLKPGFHKGYKFKKKKLNKIMMNALKTENEDQLFDSAWRFAESRKILEPTKYAAGIELMEAAERSTKKGAAVSQVVLTILNGILIVITGGAWTAIAPWTHKAISGGKKVTTAKIKRDKRRAEKRYKIMINESKENIRKDSRINNAIIEERKQAISMPTITNTSNNGKVKTKKESESISIKQDKNQWITGAAVIAVVGAAAWWALSATEADD